MKRSALFVTLVGFLGQLAQAQDLSPLEPLVGKLIDGGEWRTPNPDRADENQPDSFALRYEWGPHRRHMVGELVGIFAERGGEREVRYWTLYMFYNPASREARAMQVGWNGAIADGVAFVDADGRVVIEQTLQAPDGSTSEIRHVETFDASGESYRAEVFGRDADGEWQPMREWLWTRHRTDR